MLKKIFNPRRKAEMADEVLVEQETNAPEDDVQEESAGENCEAKSDREAAGV